MQSVCALAKALGIHKVTESGWKRCTVVEVEIELKYLCNISPYLNMADASCKFADH